MIECSRLFSRHLVQIGFTIRLECKKNSKQTGEQQILEGKLSRSCSFLYSLSNSFPNVHSWENSMGPQIAFLRHVNRQHSFTLRRRFYFALLFFLYSPPPWNECRLDVFPMGIHLLTCIIPGVEVSGCLAMSKKWNNIIHGMCRIRIALFRSFKDKRVPIHTATSSQIANEKTKRGSPHAHSSESQGRKHTNSTQKRTNKIVNTRQTKAGHNVKFLDCLDCLKIKPTLFERWWERGWSNGWFCLLLLLVGPSQPLKKEVVISCRNRYEKLSVW